MKQKIKKFFTLNRRANGGFTLVELVVVIAILAILAGAAVPAYSGYINKANEAADQQLLAALNTAYASACAAEGESHIGRRDVANITLDANKQIPAEYVLANSDINSNFRMFFPDGQFKQFDKLLFVGSLGIFTENTLEALAKVLKDVWDNSNFAGNQEALAILSNNFDLFADFFSGNHPQFEEGFSLDQVIAGMPEDVQNVFGFESCDVTADQLDALLMEYGEGYAEAPDKEQWIKTNQDLVNTIKGNAYVMNIAKAATSGVTANGIKDDVSKMMIALNDLAKLESTDEIWELYQKNNPNSTYTSFEELYAACQNDELEIYGLGAETLVALTASGVKNESGISTLGSMYALASGYINSDEYEASTNKNLSNSMDSFPEVLQAMQHEGFQAYLTSGNAVNDIEAYLTYMEYITENGVDMDSTTGAFGAMGNEIWGIVGGSN